MGPDWDLRWALPLSLCISTRCGGGGFGDGQLSEGPPLLAQEVGVDI